VGADGLVDDVDTLRGSQRPQTDADGARVGGSLPYNEKPTQSHGTGPEKAQADGLRRRSADPPKKISRKSKKGVDMSPLMWYIGHR